MLKQIFKLFLLAALLSGPAYADLVIEITEGIKRRPVAVVPFGWEGSSPVRSGCQDPSIAPLGK